MESTSIKSQKDAIIYNPLAYEQKLLVNRKCKTLEELRQSFRPETSSVLNQVRDFLPKLATANEELHKRLENEPASAFDIEEIENDGPHIQMDLALFEEDSSDVDSDSSVDSEDETCNREINENNLKLVKDSNNKQIPVIQVLSETDRIDYDVTRKVCDFVKCDKMKDREDDIS